MSENFDDLFDNGGNTEPNDAGANVDESKLPKQLREYAERQKARADAAEKALADHLAQTRTKQVDDFIKAKGLDEKVKNLIGDRKPEEWFEEYGALFAAANSTPETPAPEDVPSQEPSGQPALTPEQIAQMQATAAIQPGAFNPGSIDEVASKADNIISSAVSEDEMLRQLAELG